MKKIILNLLGALAVFSTAVAQGTAFTYQGRLADGGSPANGNYELTFRLFDVGSGGSTVAGPLTNSPSGITNGLFTVTLDFGTAFDGSPRWVEIGVRTNGSGAFTTLSPRQEITSTPYAIQSANAASAVSVSGSISAAQLTGSISSNNIGTGSITGEMLATGAVGYDQLADGTVTAEKVFAVPHWFALTISNPAPVYDDHFGSSVAAVGADRILVGVPDNDIGQIDSGVAFLFGTSGDLLTTFTNPTPAGYDAFGASMAALGTDHVLIGSPYDDAGAPRAGAVHLFNTSGILITTFTNPTPAAYDNFGISIATLGTDRVLIGSPYDNTSAPGAGAAYLFSTNGVLLATFSKPAPAANDGFGSSVAVIGSGHVLIGVPGDSTAAVSAGAAYLFSTNGTLVASFTKPMPAVSDLFGTSVAAVGTDRVLIGAPRATTWVGSSGAAYLFDTNGVLLTTFISPTPTASDWFGSSVAVLGTDRVLIGASFHDTATAVGGAAYLFSTDGPWLTTFTSPTPTLGVRFGYSMAAVGTDQLLIGAYWGEKVHLFASEIYNPGLVAERVSADSINTINLKDGAVTLAKLDPSIGVWARAGNDVFRQSGNVGIGTSNFTGNRLQVAGMVGATAFNTTSDRATKHDFEGVDAQAVLAKVAALPITQWRFKEFPSVVHLGPMAQDFRAAFNLGMDDKHISTVDADGVALAAIQGLNQKLETENAALKARLEKLERLVESLAAKQ